MQPGLTIDFVFIFLATRDQGKFCGAERRLKKHRYTKIYPQGRRPRDCPAHCVPGGSGADGVDGEALWREWTVKRCGGSVGSVKGEDRESSVRESFKMRRAAKLNISGSFPTITQKPNDAIANEGCNET